MQSDLVDMHPCHSAVVTSVPEVRMEYMYWTCCQSCQSDGLWKIHGSCFVMNLKENCHLNQPRKTYQDLNKLFTTKHLSHLSGDLLSQEASLSNMLYRKVSIVLVVCECVNIWSTIPSFS